MLLSLCGILQFPRARVQTGMLFKKANFAAKTPAKMPTTATVEIL